MAIVKANLQGEDTPLTGPQKNGIATTSSIGEVKPDGTSLTIDVDGTLHVKVDDALSDSSKNPVQNKVIEAKLKEMINPIDVTKQVTLSSTTVATNYGTTFYKLGKVMFCTINLTVKANSSSTIIIGKIPKELVPYIGPAINTVTNKGDGVYVYISGTANTVNAGEFGFHKTNESSSWVEGDGMRVCFSYCIP